MSIAYFEETLTKIEVAVIYWMCTRDCLEGVWDFSIVIKMDFLNELYTAPM